MKEVIPAHLRRGAALLSFVDDNKREAEVVWRGRSLGTWGSLEPSHRLDARGMRLVLRTRDGRLSFRVSTAHYTAFGAEILLSGELRCSDRIIGLYWRAHDMESPAHPAPELLRKSLISWVRSLIPGTQILSFAQRSDRANSLSGSYCRIHARASGTDYLILAARSTSQAGEIYESAVSQALVWVTLMRRRRCLCAEPRIHVVAPEECAPILHHRAGLLSPSLPLVEVWAYETSARDVLSVKRAPEPEPPKENREFRWPLLGPFQWSAGLEQVLNLAPSHIRRYPRFQDYDSLRLWGLEFATARGERRECITFGIGPDKVELNEDNFERLRTLVDEILYFRRPDSPDPRHPYYRLQAERWLEALILEETPRLFPELVPQSVYPQIPVYLGKDPGRVDILGADGDGTLVILELKVSPDPDLPIQALDYWGGS